MVYLIKLINLTIDEVEEMAPIELFSILVSGRPKMSFLDIYLGTEPINTRSCVFMLRSNDAKSHCTNEDNSFVNNDVKSFSNNDVQSFFLICFIRVYLTQLFMHLVIK